MALPEDIFHDGANYVCMDGTKSADHPCLGEHLAVLLAELNAEGEAENAKVGAELARAEAEAKKYLKAVPL